MLRSAGSEERQEESSEMFMFCRCASLCASWQPVNKLVAVPGSDAAA
jgi:hypothetical protein